MSRHSTNSGGSGKPFSRQQYHVDAMRKEGKRNKKYFMNKPTGSVVIDVTEYLSNDYLECLECGHDYRCLTKHLQNTHDMGRVEYCIKYGLPENTKLMGVASKAKISANSLVTSAIHTAIKKTTQCPDCNKTHEINLRAHYSNRGNGVVCTECSAVRSNISTKKSAKKHEYSANYTCAYCHTNFETKNFSLHRKVKKGTPVYCSDICGGKHIINRGA